MLIFKSVHKFAALLPIKGWGVQACYFEKHDFALGVKEEDQDTSRHFAGGFVHAMLPM